MGDPGRKQIQLDGLAGAMHRTHRMCSHLPSTEYPILGPSPFNASNGSIFSANTLILRIPWPVVFVGVFDVIAAHRICVDPDVLGHLIICSAVGGRAQWAPDPREFVLNKWWSKSAPSVRSSIMGGLFVTRSHWVASGQGVPGDGQSPGGHRQSTCLGWQPGAKSGKLGRSFRQKGDTRPGGFSLAATPPGRAARNACPS